MATRQILFDLETIKKIQAGEIKGTILTRDGRPARFLGEIKDPVYPIVFAIETKHSKEKDEAIERLDTYTLTGNYCNVFDERDNDIIVEIEDNNKKPECLFKVGDRVRLKPNNTHSYFVRQYKNCVGKIIEIFNETFIVVLDGVFQDLFKADELELVKKQKTHEFKPFDRVLVRDSCDEEWMAGIFSHMTDLPQSFACVGNVFVYQCIPYEGNEHLIGTTDKPKED